MHSSKGFSLIELMIVVGIIGILSLIVLPFYDNYVMRVKLTELNFEIMERYRYLESEYMITDPSGARSSIAADLCDSNTITIISSDSFRCIMLPGKSLFPVVTTLEVGSANVDQYGPGMVSYLEREGEGRGGFLSVSMHFRVSSGDYYAEITPPEKIVAKYIGNRAESALKRKTLEIRMSKHGLTDLDLYGDSVNMFAPKIIKKGETKVTRTDVGKMYCSYFYYSPYAHNYTPPIQARPTVCKSTYDHFRGIILE